MQAIVKVLLQIYRNLFNISQGSTAITGTSAVTPPTGQAWSAVCIVTANTTVASITINGKTMTDYAGVTLPSGFCFYGNITSITLGTGTAIGYVGSFNLDGVSL